MTVEFLRLQLGLNGTLPAAQVSTGRGGVGIGPSNVREGDLVTELPGARHRGLLRSEKEGCFSFQGFTYIRWQKEPGVTFLSQGRLGHVESHNCKWISLI
jgi:hypothetical protein